MLVLSTQVDIVHRDTAEGALANTVSVSVSASDPNTKLSGTETETGGEQAG